MDADEKLNALKKAYADIILNMSKEAAGRVMTSEGKAVRYQHELKVTKEEALRMMMRLKQMMDSKVCEAEAASVNQQKKIEELEAQLDEAEDIVRDLRQELSIVRDEYEKVKKDNKRLVNEADNTSSEQISIESRIYSHESSPCLPAKSHDECAITSDATIPYVGHINTHSSCLSEIDCSCNSFAENQDLPSIMLRGIESGLYRKACSQRIHACERNSFDREFCLFRKLDKPKDKTLSELENKRLADVKDRSCNPFLLKRKRTNRKPSTRKKSDVFLKFEHLHISAGEDPLRVKSSHSNENPLIVSRLPPDKDEELTLLGLSEYSGKDEAKTDKYNGFTEELLPCMETGVTENIRSLDCKKEVETVDVASNTLNETSTGLPSQPRKERVIKITFERKRKRKNFSGSGDSVPLRTQERIVEKWNGHQDLGPTKSSLVSESQRDSKSSLVLESLRDDRQLEQVALQLIALSETKGWD